MFKGEARIELRDTKTQSIEIYREENVMTNAVPDIFSNNPSGLLYLSKATTNTFDQELFPIATTCFGGLLLFEEKLAEDINQYYAPSTNQVVGYASQDTNDTTNDKKGSLNLSESGPIEKGYKFVWDFSTSQGNGRISSMALTHYKAGLSYYGDQCSAKEACLIISRLNIYSTSEWLNYYNWMVEANYATNTFISIVPIDKETIDILVCTEPLLTLGLKDNVANNPPYVVKKTSLSVPDLFKGELHGYQIDFHDGKDGYWYGFTSKSDSQSNQTFIKRIKIKKSDYSFSIDQWTLPNVVTSIIGRSSKETNGLVYRSKYALLKEGYLYFPNNSRDIIYKMNINNPVDISNIELGFTSKYTSGQNTNLYIYPWGDFIRGYDFLIDQNDRVFQTAGAGLPSISTPMIEVGPYRLGYNVYKDGNTQLQKTLLLHTPYLGTINNLSSPILKTADKTMKIIYTLTEMED